jgi:hypothetical protein
MHVTQVQHAQTLQGWAEMRLVVLNVSTFFAVGIQYL